MSLPVSVVQCNENVLDSARREAEEELEVLLLAYPSPSTVYFTLKNSSAEYGVRCSVAYRMGLLRCRKKKWLKLAG